MAFTAGEIVYKITGDASQLNKTLSKTEGATKSATRGFKAFDTALKASVIIALVAAAKKLVEFTGVAIKAGSEAEEVANKFNAVFSSIRGEATDSVKELAAAYNLSSVEAQRLVGNTGDILTGLGTTQKAALDLSLQVNSLAADLASFNNIPVKQASEAITKALLGERESIKTLGIAIGEEDVKRQLQIEGRENLTGLALRQAKAEATLTLALEQSKNAIGDVERSRDSLANKTKEYKATQADLTAEIGKYLQGPAKLAVQSQIDFNRSLLEGIQNLADFGKSFKESEKGAIVLATIQTAATGIRDSFSSARSSFALFASQLGKSGADGLSTKITALTGKFEDLTNISIKAIRPLVVLTTTFAGVGNVVKLVGQILGGFLNVFIDLSKAIKQGGSALLTFFSVLSGKASLRDFKREVAGIGSDFVNLKNNAVKNLNAIETNFKTFSERTVADGKKYADKITSIAEQNRKSSESTATETTKAADSVEKSLEKVNKKTKEVQKTWDGLSFGEKFNILATSLDQSLSAYSNYLNAVNELEQAQFQNDIARLDEKLQAELVAAGVAEETQVEKYQRELEEAITAGDAEAEAEARKNLTRAKIEEKYQKKKAKIEYEAALANWEIQKQLALINMFQAPLNAYVSALAIPLVGPYIAPALAAAALLTATKQYQAVEASKPEKPKFALGGIVPGQSFSGDNVQAGVNSGEMVLNQQQQGQLFKLANGQGGGNQNVIQAPSIEELWAAFTQWIRDGKILVFREDLS